ncbi:MAG TPA: carboxypeptidase-like regulatory domain-containing protein [Gemmatimonadales bacterium]|nr:carboxypeptidase-like regulatory domain-containing protein [Gemmatimonadales bacterium]
MSSLPPLFPRSRPDRRKPPLAPARRRPWGAAAGSAIIHAALIALAVLISRHEAEVLDARRTEQPRDSTRQVTIPFYIPPAPKPPPPPPQPRPTPEPAPAPIQPPPRPLAPPPVKRQPDPEPEPNAPPEERASKGANAPDKAADGSERTPTRAPDAAAPKASDYSTAPTLESEARRIFGRRHEGPPPGAGPRDVRPLQAYLPDDSTKCIRRPAPPAESAGAIHYGVAVGRIFRQDTGQPLAGAHLQMIGTPYTAFTDETGEYHFRFDMALVDNCRTQYVRVTASGYESRLLVLMVGPNVRSEDVALRRRH